MKCKLKISYNPTLLYDIDQGQLENLGFEMDTSFESMNEKA